MLLSLNQSTQSVIIFRGKIGFTVKGNSIPAAFLKPTLLQLSTVDHKVAYKGFKQTFMAVLNTEHYPQNLKLHLFLNPA